MTRNVPAMKKIRCSASIARYIAGYPPPLPLIPSHGPPIRCRQRCGNAGHRPELQLVIGAGP
jgi:hypothetical protein